MIKTDALIIGAGPTGLFTAHQLKLIGLNCDCLLYTSDAADE